MAGIENIEKFCREYRKQRFAGTVIHGLHTGTDREAELRVDELENMLAAGKKMYVALQKMLHARVVRDGDVIDEAMAALRTAEGQP